MVYVHEVEPDVDDEIISEDEGGYQHREALDDYDPENETLRERLLALTDVIPGGTKRWASKVSSYVLDGSWAVISVVGRVAWSAVVAGFVVGLPIAYSQSTEEMMEAQMKMYPQGMEVSG